MKLLHLEKPILIFDADCGFCLYWIDYWKQLTGDAIDYQSYQLAAGQFPGVVVDRFKESVKLALPDGRILSGAHAVFAALAHAKKYRWLLWKYEHVPGVAALAEWFYRLVARNRGFFFKLSALLWGKRREKPTFVFTRWIFLRLLGIVYLIAFFSFGSQIIGLIGSQGILPAAQLMQTAATNNLSWLQLPTLGWFSASDTFLQGLAYGGAGIALLVVLDILTAPALVLLWAGYLSLVALGQEFMSFQWDILLLEVGLLAIFLAPWRLYRKAGTKRTPSLLMIWLYRILIFRLMFSSGVVKLVSGDKTWSDFTALTYHYFTQPIPNALAWFANQLPVWFQKFSVGGMFAVQLILPFFIFLPRRLRFLAAGCFIGLELLIASTGNYTFFNLLTIALCLLLFDDQAIRWLVPERYREAVKKSEPQAEPRLKRWTVGIFAVAVLALGATRIEGLFVRNGQIARATEPLNKILQPFYVVNHYGLFAIMTTQRQEIIVEGSNDGTNWLAYEFKYKPGDLKRAPPFVAPHQPRLDWQMWFAALSPVVRNQWFISFSARLLEGAPRVEALLETNPFSDAPPKLIRAVLYDYQFTNSAEKAKTGEWWKRTPVGLYLPPAALQK